MLTRYRVLVEYVKVASRYEVGLHLESHLHVVLSALVQLLKLTSFVVLMEIASGRPLGFIQLLLSSKITYFLEAHHSITYFLEAHHS